MGETRRELRLVLIGIDGLGAADLDLPPLPRTCLADKSCAAMARASLCRISSRCRRRFRLTSARHLNVKATPIATNPSTVRRTTAMVRLEAIIDLVKLLSLGAVGVIQKGEKLQITHRPLETNWP